MTLDENKPVLALFDFDGTITSRDTLPLFIRFTNGLTRLCVKGLGAAPSLGGYCLGLINNQRAKENLLAAFLRGWSRQKLEKAGEDFSRWVIDKIVRPEALARIEWHRGQGHKVLVISASPEEWVRPWAEKNGLICLATRLEYADDKFTGRFEGLNCHGYEKVYRLRLYLQAEPTNYYIYAYGDSGGDRAMLDLADEPFYKPFRGS